MALPIYYLPYTGIYACGRCDNSGKKSFIRCLVCCASRPYLGEVNTRSFVYTVRSYFCPSPERNLPVRTSEKSTHPTITQRRRAVIYCRVSTDKQEQDGETLEYQEDKCRRYAELHDLDVVAVLKEAKSGFIHYSLREKLTLARQIVRDGMADMIIVFDLRRFSRNFVHSAMIFEEIESNGAEIVSVSENIDNSLTGKLIRSILAWSAESERHKIVEYANRRWQTRVEVGLPVGTGRSPYGWDWQDKEKTGYVVNQEQAAVRVPIFHMFVELDMSLRAITHKLTTNKADKSHLPLNNEDFLLRGHIYCATCTHTMKPRTQKKGRLTQKGTDKSYPFYACANTHNKYKACPSLTTIRTSPLDEIVWQECCVLFKRIDVLQAALEQEMEAAISALLEDTTGQEQIQKIETTIEFAKNEREKYVPGSYMHNLISQDITNQEEQLARYKEEIGSSNIEKVTGSYQQRIMEFLEFLNVMRGRYENATFQEKRNALQVLGVRVMVHEPTETYGLSSDALDIADGQEWFSAKEAGQLLGVHAKTIRFYQKNGTITKYKDEPFLLVHRDELLKLQRKGFLQRNTEEIVRDRVEISYSPRFIGRGNNLTAAPVSLQTRRYI